MRLIINYHLHIEIKELWAKPQLFLQLERHKTDNS